MPKRRVVHFQCLKNDDRKETEEAGLKREGRLSDDEIVVIEAFKAPVPLSALFDATHVTIGGSGWSVWEDMPYQDELRTAIAYAEDGLCLPVLGICFGGQFLARMFGGSVVRDNAREERGTVDIVLDPSAAEDPLFRGLPSPLAAQSSHQDRIERLPSGAIVLAHSQDGAVIQAFTLPGSRIYGVQFHPERCRKDVEFLIDPAHCDYEPHQVEMVRRTLADSPEAGKVLERFFRL